MTATAGFVCDICGRARGGVAEVCPHCSSNVCAKCWHNQANGKGHELAEHRHEMAYDAGHYTRGDEDFDE